MKRIVKIVVCALIAAAMMIPSVALASNPALKSISFSNCKIDTEFTSEVNNYTITLDDPNVTPILQDYKIEGDANILVTYSTDDANHQTGIVVTLEYENGTTIYSFDYKNAKQYDLNSNNNLAELQCPLCEVYPAINDEDTTYKLYVPSDMTELKLTAVTQDIAATCDVINTFALNDDATQLPTITVTASDGSTKTYTFYIKRLNKTMAQVEAEMQRSDFTSLVEDELFYRQPKFLVAGASIIGGIIVIIILIMITKRLTVKVCDDDEEEFFDIQEEDSKEE